MKKRSVYICLLLLLVWATLVLSSCAMSKYKVEKPEGETHTIEYWRMGDQELSGLDVGKEDPNGIKFWARLDSQKSEGKLQIEGVISALGEIAATLMTKGDAATAAKVEAIKEQLAAQIASP